MAKRFKSVDASIATGWLIIRSGGPMSTVSGAKGPQEIHLDVLEITFVLIMDAMLKRLRENEQEARHGDTSPVLPH